MPRATKRTHKESGGSGDEEERLAQRSRVEDTDAGAARDAGEASVAAAATSLFGRAGAMAGGLLESSGGGADGDASDTRDSTSVIVADRPPAKTYPFKLDTFQQQSVNYIERNESVLVSAHTSAGKTVVAEYAIALSLREKQRVIYTSPIKALSNQKYRDLYEEFGDVGLMTGDVTISPNASCLVMTTEILRSMLYRGSDLLREVAWVIFDEIHYMRDKERGVVWEESIVMLPHKVRFVFLSATIPNASEFAAWISAIHLQPCHVVYTDYRPTPLQHYFFPSGGEGLYLVVDEKGKFRQENFSKAMANLSTVQDEAKLGVSLSTKSGKRKQAGKGGPSDLHRIVKMIMERNYDPVIVFSFSKRDCERYALQMAKLDFTNDDEKALIDTVFTNAIDALSDDDKALPQVNAILPLLKRGIGIHHGGLLPILKEVIEIMFQESLVKCLFATETFAMGINMPAKTVVFTNARKFDGQEFRWVTAGEYIQMSGRAGRRGLDDRGIVIQMIDEKLEVSAAKGMLKGNADPLNSSFHLGYNMLLNLLRVEGADPESVIASSFYQFQQERQCPALEHELAKVTAERDAVSIDDEAAVAEYHHLNVQADRIKEDMRAITNLPNNILPFLEPGRLARVRDGQTDFGWGVLLNFQKKRLAGGAIGSADGKPDSAGGTHVVADVLLSCKVGSMGGADPIPAALGSPVSEMRAVPVLVHLFDGISSVRIRLPKNLNHDAGKVSVAKTLAETFRRLPDGIPLLDPIEHMQIKDTNFDRLAARLADVQNRILKSSIHAASDRDTRFSLFKEKLQLGEQLRQLKRDIKAAKSLSMKDTLKRMQRVLRRLGHTDGDNVVQLKGRVACEVNTADELLVTELIFNGVFNDLNPAQTAALASCLVYKDKGSEGDEGLPAELAAPLRELQSAARKIAKISQEAKLGIDVEEYVESFRPDMMQVVYNWVNGAKFVDICTLTTAFEGTIIRCIRRLEELMRQLADAAKSIGDEALETKFTTASDKMKRDIIFAASLYL